MTDSHNEQTLLDPTEARTLADDLVNALARSPGDPARVRVIMRRFLEVLGPHDLALVCVCAVYTVFADCIHEVPAHTVRPGQQVGNFERKPA